MRQFGWLFVGLAALACRSAVVVQGEVPREAEIEGRLLPQAEASSWVSLVSVGASEIPRVREVAELIEPSSGQLVSSADGLLVRWSVPAPGLPERMVVMVDDGPVVTLFPGETNRPVESFLDPGAMLERGDHRVVLCAMGGLRLARTQDDVAACHVVFFSVGRRVEAARPGVVVMTPHGTYSGPAETKRIPLDVFGVGGAFEGSQHYALVRIGRVGASPVVHGLVPGRAYALENLPSGDYTLEVLLHDSDGRPVEGRWTRAVRTITINADVPDEPLTEPGASSAP